MKFKKIISALICCVMLLSATAFAGSDIVAFSDLPSTHWAYNDVMTIANKGIISGTTTPVNGVGTYDPDGTVTLGQFLAIATRLVAKDLISDIDYGHWAYNYYKAAVDSGLIKKSDFSGKNGPLDDTISRQDMAYILVNVAKLNGETLQYKEGIKNNISDFTSIYASRRDAVLLAYSNGLLTGKDNNRFAPYEYLTRAEVAAVFCRVMNYIKRPEVMVQQQNQETKLDADSYIVTEDGETLGLIRPKYAREFDMQALDNLRIGEDATGVYMEFTAPTLPDELKEHFWCVAGCSFYESDGSSSLFIGGVSVRIKSGEYVKKYITNWEDNYFKKDIIDSAQATVSVQSIKLLDRVLSHTVYMYSKTQAKEAWYNNIGNSIIEYDSNHIFAGIGK